MGAIFRWIRDIWLGRRQLGQTTERATAVVTAATVPLFTVSGGRIKVTQILGEVTTVMQALATNVRLSANPTTGTTRNMCANLNIASYAAGDLLGITGVNTDPMLPPATSGVLEAQTFGVIVQEGTIDLISDAAPTGSIKWTLKWVPIDEGAAVVAA
jgi:hypothetical protein